MGEHMAVSQGRGGCPFAHAAQVLTPQSTWAALARTLRPPRAAHQKHEAVAPCLPARCRGQTETVPRTRGRYAGRLQAATRSARRGICNEARQHAAGVTSERPHSVSAGTDVDLIVKHVELARARSRDGNSRR